MRKIRRAGICVALTAFLSVMCSAAGGTILVNETGEGAEALRVVFDRPVRIVHMGEAFAELTARDPSTTILFSDGTVPDGAGFPLFWEPDTAKLLGYEWFPTLDLEAPASSGNDVFLGATLQHYLADRIWDDDWRYVDPLRALKERGFEWVRVCVHTRSSPLLATTPVSKWSALPWSEDYVGTLEYATQLLEEAAAAGMKLNLAFYLSDEEAHGATQRIPARWEALSFEELVSAVRRYCYETTQHFIARGLEIDLYNIGNEIDFGILSYRHGDRLPDPEGILEEELGFMRSEVWSIQAQLLSAAIEGVRQADPDAKILLHTCNSHPDYPGFVIAFYETMIEHGVEFDYAGLSYPAPSGPWIDRFYDHPFKWLQTYIDAILAMGKRFVISEFLYPSNSRGVGVMQHPYWYTRPPWVVDIAFPGYPFTPEGQAEAVREFMSFLRGTEGIDGFFHFWPDAFRGSSGGVVQYSEGDESYGPFETDTQFRPSMKQYLRLPPAFPRVELREETDPAFRWSGRWSTHRQEEYSGGTVRVTDRPGASVTIPFIGTGVALTYTANDNHGIAEIEINGVQYESIDMYAPVLQPVHRLTSVITTDLTAGEHMLTITLSERKNPSSSGQYIVVDAINVIRARPEGTEPDTDPPTITSLSFEPVVLDVTETSGEIEFRVEASDSDSGTAFVGLDLVSPSGEVLSCGLYLADGTRNHGWFEGTLEIPKGVEPGTWRLGRLLAGDMSFPDQNTTEMDARDCMLAGFPTEVEIESRDYIDPEAALGGRSIQELINAASPGHVIHIPSGVYHENLVIDKDLTLRGTGPDKPLIIAAQPSRPVIDIEPSPHRREVVLEGLRVAAGTGGNGTGIVACSQTVIRVVDVEVVGNEKNGIELLDHARATIVDCVLTGNRSGIELYDAASASVENCVIEDNGAFGIHLHQGTSVELVRSRISRNGRLGRGDGIYVHEQARVSIVESEVKDNSRCGIWAESPDSIVVCTGNTVARNAEGNYCGFSADD